MMAAMSFWQNRPKHIAEYLVLCFFGGVMRLLPYRVALALGWPLAFLAHFVFRWRVAETRRRIREVFGAAKTEREVRRIAWIAMRNLVFNAVDNLRLPDLTIETFKKRTNFDIGDKIGVTAGGRGAIIVIPHAGSWDQAGVGLQQLGLSIFVIVARQRNPLVDAFLNRLRSINGVEAIHRDNNVVRSTVRNLKKGKVLALLPDLRSKTPGVQVKFLGKTANLVMGLGLFARMADVPVIPGFVARDGWTRHRWKTFPVILPDHTLDRDADTLRITQLVMDVFDACIRAEPEQFFWYNKRWVLDPLKEK